VLRYWGIGAGGRKQGSIYLRSNTPTPQYSNTSHPHISPSVSFASSVIMSIENGGSHVSSTVTIPTPGVC